MHTANDIFLSTWFPFFQETCLSACWSLLESVHHWLIRAASLLRVHLNPSISEFSQGQDLLVPPFTHFLPKQHWSSCQAATQLSGMGHMMTPNVMHDDSNVKDKGTHSASRVMTRPPWLRSTGRVTMTHNASPSRGAFQSVAQMGTISSAENAEDIRMGVLNDLHDVPYLAGADDKVLLDHFGPLHIESVSLESASNRKAHHTDMYDDKTLILRRGASFVITVMFSEPYPLHPSETKCTVLLRDERDNELRLAPEKSDRQDLSKERGWVQVVDFAEGLLLLVANLPVRVPTPHLIPPLPHMALTPDSGEIQRLTAWPRSASTSKVARKRIAAFGRPNCSVRLKHSVVDKIKANTGAGNRMVDPGVS